MRIGHAYGTANFESGGIVRYIFDQGRGMADRGHSVALFTSDSKEYIAQAQCEWRELIDIHAHCVRGLRDYLLKSEIHPSVAAQLKECSVIHIHGVWSPELLHIAKFARQQRIPYVVTLHGMLDSWSMSQGGFKKIAFLKLLANRMLRNATRVIASTTKEREQALRLLPNLKVQVVPPVLDLHAYQVLPTKELAYQIFGRGMAPDQPIILFLSRVHQKKGIEILIQAMKILIQESYPCSLIVAGVGEESYVQSLKGMVTDLGLDSDIRFVGMVDGELKSSLYAMADVFVLPTAQENFGLVFTESMACGTPVLTTDGIDICQELEESGGAVMGVRTPESFASSLMHMLQDRPKLVSMGLKGRAWVFREFSTARVLDQHEAIYQQAIKFAH